MRLLAAILISAGVLGGMAAYMHFVSARHVVAGFDAPPTAAGQYAVEITPSYEVGSKDPFALDVDDESKSLGLSVQLAGRELFDARGTLAAGRPIRIEPIVGLVDGKNELFVKAAVSSEQSQKSNALRVRVFRDGVELSDQTLWSDSGGQMSGKIAIDVASRQPREASHDHD